MGRMAEPTTTAFILTVLGLLMALSVVSSRLAGRAGVPVTLLFLAFGMLAGGLGHLGFHDYGLGFRLGSVALVLILFDGGLNTPSASIREGIRPAVILATIGVALTAAFTAVVARLLGLPWPPAMLLGAIIASTDSANVFAILRSSGLHLRRRVAATLEMESGLNDPMAVILTLAMTHGLLAHGISWWGILRDAAIQLAVGTVLGLAFGHLGRLLLRHARLQAGGLYPVLTIAVAFIAFGLPTLFFGSGFLAVYVAAMVMGNAVIRYRTGIVRVHDALAWFAQVTMFLMLGLLVEPKHLWEVAPIGLGVALLVALVARPLAVLLCIAPFRYARAERGYIAWAGLRGAVPIVLATFPVLADVPGAHDIFAIVFFVVVVNAFVPSATLPWVTRKLGLESKAPPAPPAVLEITSSQLLSGEVVSFYIDKASAVCGATIADLPFPPTATAAMIIRGTELVAPHGNTVLKPGDHVYVFCKPEDLPLVRLLFGRQEAE